MRRGLLSLIVLAVLAGLAGWAIAWFAEATAGRAERNRAAAENRVLRELAGVGVAEALRPGSGDVLFCAADLAVLRSASRGYGGELRIAVALDAQGDVRGVRVLEHAETPGFADILAAESDWLASFRSGHVDAVTGATVTSAAVTRAVQQAVARHGGSMRCAALGDLP